MGTFSPILHDHLARALAAAGYAITQNEDDKFFAEYGNRIVAWHVVADEVQTIEAVTFQKLFTVFDAVDHLNHERFMETAE